MALDRGLVERRSAEVERERARLVRLLARTDDEYVADSLIADISALGKQAGALDAELGRLSAERASWEADQQRLDDLQAWRRDVSRNLSLLDYAGRRLALEALGVQVRVWATNHDPRYEIRMELDAAPSINGPRSAACGDHDGAHVDGYTRRGCARQGERPAGRP